MQNKDVRPKPNVYTNWSQLVPAAIGVWDRAKQQGSLMPRFKSLLAQHGGPPNNVFTTLEVFTDFVTLGAHGLPVQHLQNATDEREVFFACKDADLANLLHGHV